MAKKIIVEWQGERAFIARNDDGGQVAINATNVDGTSLSPSEMLLAALGGCVSTTAVGVLEKKRQEFSTFEVELLGDQMPDWPKSFTSIHMICRVTGSKVDVKAVERAVELAETRYCTVASSLAPPITHEVEVELIPAMAS